MSAVSIYLLVSFSVLQSCVVYHNTLGQYTQTKNVKAFGFTCDHDSGHADPSTVISLCGSTLEDAADCFKNSSRMQGCFDAIQKKYLRTVIMSIYTDRENPQKVTEFYQFRIQYTEKGAQMDFESNNNNNNNEVSSMPCGSTKKACILLVRKLYTLMQNLNPLPDVVSLNMRLAYYDDVTPHDYQPPGFREADGDTMEFEQEPVKLTMGEVVTPFHGMRLDMVTEKRRLEQVEESIHVTKKWVQEINEDDSLMQSHVIGDVKKPDSESTDLDNTEIQMSCSEKLHTCESVMEMDTLVKRTSNMEVGFKRTRSGRIIKSTTETRMTEKSNKSTAMKENMVSQYDIPSSQETPSSSAPKKKRKFSEPKERY